MRFSKYCPLSMLLLCNWMLGTSQYGLAQSYSIDTYDGQTVNTCSGNFYDSGGSGGSYSNNEDYEVTFCSDDGGNMQLDFTSWNVEGGWDFLYVHDGSSTGASLLGTYSGSSPGTVTGSGTCLTLRFTSDNSQTRSGWAATISCTTPPTCTDFGVLVVNYNNSTMTQYDNDTGDFLNTLATSSDNLNSPNFIYQLPDGTLLVSNGSSNTVTEHDPETGNNTGTFASTGLSFPEQIKLAPNGDLYLASQSNSRVIRYELDGTVVATYTNANLTSANGIGFVGTDMYVSQNTNGGRINQYDLTGNYVGILYDYPSGEFPRGLAVDEEGDLYAVIYSSSNPRIEKWDFPAGTRSTFISMDAGSNPYAGIVWGPDGNLYVADYGEDEVQVYNSSGTELGISPITSSTNGPHGVAFVSCSGADLEVSGTPTDVTCPSEDDGSIDITVTGGIPMNLDNPGDDPYTYSWSNSATTEDVSGLTPSTYTVTVTDWNGVEVTENFTVNTPGCSLPIELLSFSLMLHKQGYVKIAWQTLTETNNDYFSVEKSRDTESWEVVTMVPGSGDSQEALSYKTEDRNPYHGTSFYRLKQTDYDGKYSYSNIIEMHINPDYFSTLRLYPNPTKDFLSIEAKPFELSDLSLYDMQGRVVTDQVKWVNQDLGLIRWDLSDLESGVYILKSGEDSYKITKE